MNKSNSNSAHAKHIRHANCVLYCMKQAMVKIAKKINNANALTRSQPNETQTNGQKQIKRVQLHAPFHDGAACVRVWNGITLAGFSLLFLGWLYSFALNIEHLQHESLSIYFVIDFNHIANLLLVLFLSSGYCGFISMEKKITYDKNVIWSKNQIKFIYENSPFTIMRLYGNWNVEKISHCNYHSNDTNDGPKKDERNKNHAHVWPNEARARWPKKKS